MASKRKVAKLKPCPFCGHKRIRRWGWSVWHWFVCRNCQATTRGAATLARAIEKWNRRTTRAKAR